MPETVCAYNITGTQETGFFLLDHKVSYHQLRRFISSQFLAGSQAFSLFLASGERLDHQDCLPALFAADTAQLVISHNADKLRTEAPAAQSKPFQLGETIQAVLACFQVTVADGEDPWEAVNRLPQPFPELVREHATRLVQQTNEVEGIAEKIACLFRVPHAALTQEIHAALEHIAKVDAAADASAAAEAPASAVGGYVSDAPLPAAEVPAPQPNPEPRYESVAAGHIPRGRAAEEQAQDDEEPNMFRRCGHGRGFVRRLPSDEARKVVAEEKAPQRNPKQRCQIVSVGQIIPLGAVAKEQEQVQDSEPNMFRRCGRGRGFQVPAVETVKSQASAEAPKASRSGFRRRFQGHLSDPAYRHEAVCDGCESGIAGVRYKCLECLDYDLCEACEAKGGQGAIHKDHVFAKVHDRAGFHTVQNLIARNLALEARTGRQGRKMSRIEALEASVKALQEQMAGLNYSQ